MVSSLVIVIITLPLRLKHDEPEEKELRATYNFYKDTKKGFFTKDGYAAVPCGEKKRVIVYQGEILHTAINDDTARNWIARHRKKRK